MKNRLKIKKNDIFKKFKKFQNLSVFSPSLPPGIMLSTVPTLIHYSLVLDINSHLSPLIRVEKFQYCQEISHISSKTTHFGFIC